MGEKGGRQPELPPADVNHREITDSEATDLAHIPARDLPGALGRMSAWHRIDRSPDPDQKTMDEDRLEDIRKYDPETWEELTRIHELPSSSEVKRRTFTDKSRIPGLTGQWEDL